ncbi:MAG: SGNH/GDSL hydrolase family protein [Jatrophihabitans sp.]
MRRVRLVLAELIAIAGLVVALASPAAAAAVNYVALGDSYSSGVGAGNYIASSGACDRSTNAYSQLWANTHSPSSYRSVACSGATTADVENNQLSALSSSTTLVSITIGGNDENFAGIMKDCNLGSDSTCVSEINAAEADARASLSTKLVTLFGHITSRAPSARLVVLNYPHFYDLAKSCFGLSKTKRAKINEATDVLASVLSSAASRAGAKFADVRPAFSGHEICDSNRWLHSVNFLDFGISYHPTADGHSKAYYPTFSAAA